VVGAWLPDISGCRWRENSVLSETRSTSRAGRSGMDTGEGNTMTQWEGLSLPVYELAGGATVVDGSAVVSARDPMGRLVLTGV